jgi:hypothetical protein
MKKLSLFLLGCVAGFSALQAQTFSDDFESYTAGIALGPQSPDWRTWSGAGGGSDDANVVTTDNHTSGGSKSIYIVSGSASGGPADIVLPFTTGAPLNTGQFTFKTWFKIPTGKNSYFNFQGTSSMGAMYVLDCWMTTTGEINIENSGSLKATGTFPHGVWFELTIEANFNTNTWELLIDGVSQDTWSNTNNQVWGIDYYPTDASSQWWFDDVSYDVVPYTLPALNAAANFLDVAPGLVGGVRFPSVTVRNLGTGTINSFDVSISQNGGAPVTQSATGLTLASLGTTTVDFTTSFTLATGANTFQAIISNVNGAGADGDAGDDTLTLVVDAVTPAAGKSVVAEEATGTWCGWCPRGAVYMDMMDTRYPGAFVPIAVHNGDPMVVTEYDDAIGALIAGYPSALVDRFPEIDPTGLETSFLDRVVMAPKVFVVNGATWDAGSRELNVSITCTNQMAISGSSRVACVLTEDDVTGTTSGYAQTNYYSGGSYGPMGGYELLGDPVPAASMVYDHVARFISPSFDGIPNAPGASTASAAVWTWNFTFVLPSTIDENEVHIVGMFLDPTGEIDNASSATIAEAVANGFVSGNVGSTAAAFEGPDQVVSLYPNPTTGASSVALNLAQAADVKVEIMNPQGALVTSKSYGELSGNMVLPVDLSTLAAGIYLVNVNVGGETTTLKLMKQ